MSATRKEVLNKRFPYYVAVVSEPTAAATATATATGNSTNSKEQIAGYAYLNSYRTRSAYRFTVENSIYIHQKFIGAGVGTILLHRLIDDATRMGFRQMMAYTSNGSDTVALHERAGFVQVGMFRSLGWKFSRVSTPASHHPPSVPLLTCCWLSFLSSGWMFACCNEHWAKAIPPLQQKTLSSTTTAF